MCRSRIGSGAAASSAAAGVLDFAGGTVVHLNAGVAGLVAAYVLGARRGYGSENLAPFDLSLAVIGTGLLWVGWFGFNGGSALGANSRAVVGDRRHASRRQRRRLHLDGAGMVDARQAVGARHDLRRGRRPRHHHAGVRLRAADARHADRHRSPAASASGPAPGSSSNAATTTRSTCSACTASAASPARCSPACSRSPRCRPARTPAACRACSKAIRSQVLAQLYGIVVTLAVVRRCHLRHPQGDRRSWCRCGCATRTK